MRTLEEIKNGYAIELGYLSWNQIGHLKVESFIIEEIAKRYAIEVAREALNNASDNAIVECEGDEFGYSYVVYKQSILSEINIPELK